MYQRCCQFLPIAVFAVVLLTGCNNEAGGAKKGEGAQGDPIVAVREKTASIKNLLNDVMAAKTKSELPAIEAKLVKLAASAGAALKTVPEVARPQYRKELEGAMGMIQREIEVAQKRLRN